MEPGSVGTIALARRYPIGCFDGNGIVVGRLPHGAITALVVGCFSAVVICLNAHHQFLRLDRDVPWTPVCGKEDVMDWPDEVRHGRPLPEPAVGPSTEGFMVHVDDLGEYEVSLVDKGANLVGTVSPLHRRSEERCSFRGTVGNGARLTSQQWFMEGLRYVTGGWAGGRDMPAIYISMFIYWTFWTLAQSKVTRRTTQGFAGH